MSREYQIPGGPVINETGTRQYQIPGGPVINETVAAAAAFQPAWALQATMTIQSGAKVA